MPTVTDIAPQKRRENRRNVFLDGRFAFGCNVTVVVRFRLRTGLTLSGDEVRKIEFGVVKQECLDKALNYLSRRLHSRAEISRKLKRHDWSDEVIESVIEDLVRLTYLDDTKFARAKATSCAGHKKLGRRRAFVDLIRAGIKGETADKALADVYAETDTAATARGLAMRAAPRLRKLELQVARRKLTASLLRRGFDYAIIRPIVDQVLGKQ